MFDVIVAESNDRYICLILSISNFSYTIVGFTELGSIWANFYVSFWMILLLSLIGLSITDSSLLQSVKSWIKLRSSTARELNDFLGRLSVSIEFSRVFSVFLDTCYFDILLTLPLLPIKELIVFFYLTLNLTVVFYDFCAEFGGFLECIEVEGAGG